MVQGESRENRGSKMDEELLGDILASGRSYVRTYVRTGSVSYTSESKRNAVTGRRPAICRHRQ